MAKTITSRVMGSPGRLPGAGIGETVRGVAAGVRFAGLCRDEGNEAGNRRDDRGADAKAEI